MQNTDLARIKEVAITFLYLEPEINKNFPFLVQHPFIASNPYCSLSKDGSFKSYNITNRNELKEVQKYLETTIKSTYSLDMLLNMFRDADKRTFFFYIKDYLSEKDYARLLRDTWIFTEFPHKDRNVSVAKFKKLFKEANKKQLLSKKELNVLDKLPETITIFRGITEPKYYTAISWTIDKKTATFFATRFNKKGAIYAAEIEKKHILAYFQEEKEVIVDYTFLQNIRVIENF